MAADNNGAVVVFDHVKLAFDDKVVLKDISFKVAKGRTKIIMGASGSGKSTILKIVVGLLKADGGTVSVNGKQVDRLSEAELMEVRDDLGMIFQEGALFDSLTVRENVGYRLYEETDTPLEKVDARVEEVLGFIGLAEPIDALAVHRHGAAVGLQQADDDLQDRRLSGSAGPHDDLRAPFGNFEADVLQHYLIVEGELHVIEDDDRAIIGGH